MRHRIIRVILLSIVIVAAIVLITHYAGSGNFDRKTAKLVWFALNG